ncbi:glycosyltransferase family protein [Vallitalea guaymasensis]|uniref:glycosyltransferase family protein n=1 Tax=Vallitalea guaymasensis TaxID=1185412 RepID=UPI000DE1F893|nr:glycosyltransferase family protein [Vallitalea guaymasensis]
MNDKRVAFIICVNNDDLYDKAVKYINGLLVPDGFVTEIVDIRNQKSMTSGYNKGMISTDAKYKIYLHQDVFITNKNFIVDIIEIFNRDADIGLIGVIGSKYIPADGIWWKSNKKRGKVYDSHRGKIELLNFQGNSKTDELVSGIDGLIMITQYDIPWREDIFTGWHFYDISQCLEFIRKGYKIAVPYQEEPWCIHDCGIVNLYDYDRYRLIFLKEYKKELKS